MLTCMYNILHKEKLKELLYAGEFLKDELCLSSYANRGEKTLFRSGENKLIRSMKVT